MKRTLFRAAIALAGLACMALAGCEHPDGPEDFVDGDENKQELSFSDVGTQGCRNLAARLA